MDLFTAEETIGLLARNSPPALLRYRGAIRGALGRDWLTREQANLLLILPDVSTRNGERDRALLGLLVGCGLRREELVGFTIDALQLPDNRCVIPGARLGQGAIDAWLAMSGVSSGCVFRASTTADKSTTRASPPMWSGRLYKATRPTSASRK